MEQSFAMPCCNLMMRNQNARRHYIEEEAAQKTPQNLVHHPKCVFDRSTLNVIFEDG